MSISGRFIGNAPYFPVLLSSSHFEGFVWLLADTGASRTTLLDRDARLLDIPISELEPGSTPIVGVGGSVRSWVARNAELTLASNQGDFVIHQDVLVAQHDLDRLPQVDRSRILKIPSVMGRDVINRFRFTCDSRSGMVDLEV